MSEKDFSKLPQRQRQKVRLTKSNPKEFMVENFRVAFMAEDQAKALYSYIRERIIQELLAGRRVNLFGVVLLEPVDAVHNTGFYKDERVVKKMRKIKPRIPSNFRTEWGKAYVQHN